jgi:hypothetical protein
MNLMWVTILIYVGMHPRLPLYKFILLILPCQGKHLNLKVVYFFLYHEHSHTSDVNIVPQTFIFTIDFVAIMKTTAARRVMTST